jgi:hypothetical protein
MIYGFWWKKPFDVACPKQAIRKLERELDPLVDEKGKLEDFRYFLAGTAYDDIDFLRRSRVPTFYSGSLTDNQGIWVFVAELVTAVIFGGIHIIAWKFVFPTQVEQIMWRASAIVVTAAPIASVIVVAMFAGVLTAVAAARVAWDAIIMIYIVARLILLTISFSSLRALPPGAFVAVNWTTFIPHVS